MNDVRESSKNSAKPKQYQVNKHGEIKEIKRKNYLILKPIITCYHNQNWTKYGVSSRNFLSHHIIWRGISRGCRMRMDNDVWDNIWGKKIFGIRSNALFIGMTIQSINRLDFDALQSQIYTLYATFANFWDIIGLLKTKIAKEFKLLITNKIFKSERNTKNIFR